GIEHRVAELQLYVFDEQPVVLAGLALSLGHDAVDADNLVLRRGAVRAGRGNHGDRKSGENGLQHPPVSCMTSPRRKIDSATTTRRERLVASATAAPGGVTISTGTAASIARMRAASYSGSAARGFDGRMTITRAIAGSSTF